MSFDAFKSTLSRSVPGEFPCCSDLIWFLFSTPQEEYPVRGEIVLTSNDLQLVLQVERNQWVFLLSYHLRCLNTLIIPLSSTWDGGINWEMEEVEWSENRSYQKAATTLLLSFSLSSVLVFWLLSVLYYRITGLLSVSTSWKLIKKLEEMALRIWMF